MGSNVSNFPIPGRKIQKSKAGPQSLPLHPDEKLVLEAYFRRRDPESPELLDTYRRLEVPEVVECTRLEAAVAQVLLHAVQGRLPQWAAVYPDGKVALNRRYRRRAPGQALAFVAQALCEINWADSGPGFSWPEAYHLLYVPG